MMYRGIDTGVISKILIVQGIMPNKQKIKVSVDAIIASVEGNATEKQRHIADKYFGGFIFHPLTLKASKLPKSIIQGIRDAGINPNKMNLIAIGATKKKVVLKKKTKYPWQVFNTKGNGGMYAIPIIGGVIKSLATVFNVIIFLAIIAVGLWFAPKVIKFAKEIIINVNEARASFRGLKQ